MAYRTLLRAAALVSTLVLSGPVAAQTPESSTSGPNAGVPVVPSTAIQDKYEGRSTSRNGSGEPRENLGAPTAVGAPGVEGRPGTQSGRAVK
jgi:hypothetical protein